MKKVYLKQIGKLLQLHFYVQNLCVLKTEAVALSYKDYLEDTAKTYYPEYEFIDEVSKDNNFYYDVRDNSDGFRNFLNSKNISWVSNGSFTTLTDIKNLNIFDLGVQFANYKASFDVKKHY